MMWTRSALMTAIAATIWLVSSSSAAAQTVPGAYVSGSVATANENGDNGLSLAGSVGYRFTRAFGLAAEVTSISGTGGALFEPTGYYFNFLPRRPDFDTNVLLLTANIHIEVPTKSSRILPFVSIGGGGAWSSASQFDRSFAAVTLGGGVSVIVRPHLSVDADVRTILLHTRNSGGAYLYYREHEGAIGRFGGGLTYRF